MENKDKAESIKKIEDLFKKIEINLNKIPHDDNLDKLDDANFTKRKKIFLDALDA
jgi:hypothetical protein